MQLSILQALALVSVGNEALAGRDAGAFWPDDDLFRFSKQVEFVIARGDERYDSAAPDPLAWFEWLRARGCSGLRLHNAPMQQRGRLQVEERMMVGFVGGGPRWLIEACMGARSEIWEGFDRIGERDDPERKIWRTAYIMQGEAEPQINVGCDVAEAAADVDAALASVEPVAVGLGAGNFAKIFGEARRMLNEGSREHEPSFVRLTSWEAPERNLLNATMCAWVFGGMGSWNDIGGAGPAYEKASENLFAALQRAVLALANVTCKI